MADLIYANGKCNEAVECLVKGKGRIRERLAEAYQEGFVMVGREVLPEDAKPAYDEIQELLSINDLSEDEAQRAAGLIYELSFRLSSAVNAKQSS